MIWCSKRLDIRHRTRSARFQDEDFGSNINRDAFLEMCQPMMDRQGMGGMRMETGIWIAWSKMRLAESNSLSSSEMGRNRNNMCLLCLLERKLEIHIAAELAAACATCHCHSLASSNVLCIPLHCAGFGQDFPTFQYHSKQS